MTQNIDRDPESERKLDLTQAEFRDYDGPLLQGDTGFDLSNLLTSESLRGLAAIAVSILVIRTPSQSPRAFAVLVAAILLAWAVGGLAELRNKEHRSIWAVGRIVLLIAVGAVLILIPEFTSQNLGRLIGIGFLAMAGFAATRAIRNNQRGSRMEPLLSAFFYAVIGLALIAAPKAFLGIAVLLASVYWFLMGLMTILVNLRLDDRQIEPAGTWQMFLQWVQGRPNTVDDRNQLYEKIFYEGEAGPRRLSRFFTLMGFATAIAAWGIVADSTAVVIGAMLVAPLMTPLMGTSLSMVMGWPRRALMSLGVAVGGILFAIGLSVIFGWIYGPDISTVANTQVASRIGPTLIDLMIAIAAGGAGAFAISRPDVSDSLPGVAVAIALVPPLSVVGLMVSQTNWAAASGALLLFLTNMVAIILVGGLVFVLTGVVPLLQLSQNSQWIKRSLGMVAALAVAIIAVLGINLDTFDQQSAGLAKAEDLVEQWLGDTSLELSQLSFANDTFIIVLAGPEAPPPIDELAVLVEDETDTAYGLKIHWIPSETIEYQP